MALDKEDIKQLIAILQKGLTDDMEEENPPEIKSKSGSTKTTNNKKKYHNKFETMTEAGMHKEDVEIDRRLRKLPPTQRSRDYQPLKVRCRVCGREELANPSLVESIDRYKCNKCSTSAG